MADANEWPACEFRVDGPDGPCCGVAAGLAGVKPRRMPVMLLDCQRCAEFPDPGAPNMAVATVAVRGTKNTKLGPNVARRMAGLLGQLPCVHRGREVLGQIPCPCPRKPIQDVHHCELHDAPCVISESPKRFIGFPDAELDEPPIKCGKCRDRKIPNTDPIEPDPDEPPPPPARKQEPKPREPVALHWQPGPIVPGLVTGRGGPKSKVSGDSKSVDGLANQFMGASVFLVCGGPSVAQTPVELLNQRGITVAAVNQIAATHVRPHVWITVDDASSFHASAWRDPGIPFKFTMRARSRRGARETAEQLRGDEASDEWSRRQPGVYFFDAVQGVDPATFLTQDRLTWCGTGKSVKVRSVFLVALRLLYWLGFRCVYLVGCDFHYRPGQTYAFDDPKGKGACGTNNGKMAALNEEILPSLLPEFRRAGFHVYNATRPWRDGKGVEHPSKLTVFPRIDFADAVRIEAGRIPPVTNVRGLY